MISVKIGFLFNDTVSIRTMKMIDEYRAGGGIKTGKGS
jgi:hypothetical protein